MKRASMPEAAVDEDGDPGTSEHDVGDPPEVWLWPHVDPISEAQRVQPATQGKLRLGVAARMTRHPRRRLRG